MSRLGTYRAGFPAAVRQVEVIPALLPTIPRFYIQATKPGKLTSLLMTFGMPFRIPCVHYIIYGIYLFFFGDSHLTSTPPPKTMSISSSLLIAVVALVSVVVSISIPVSQESNILFEGRLPWSTALSDLDSYSTSPYNAEYVIGAGMYYFVCL